MTDGGTIAVFGAGNIGRSFVGQLFARAGWKVVFIDVDADLVAELNRRGSYRIVVKRQGREDEGIEVQGVSAVNGGDAASVSALLACAGLAACCVGKAALPSILPALASGLLERERRPGAPPLDLIMAENDRGAPGTIRSGLAAILPAGFPLGERLGLVETSIGKMVPLMDAGELAKDRLLLFAEEYNSLVLDGNGFLGPVPKVDGLLPVDRIDAYVDRKLFVHNLGHAATAYLGHARHPDAVAIWSLLEDPVVAAGTRDAMLESAAAIGAEYPAVFEIRALAAHVEDLLARFANRALGDTVYRVGRDIPRKLAGDDRIVGAIRLAVRHGLPWRSLARVAAAAFSFRAVDARGRLHPADAAFHEELARRGPAAVLVSVSGLDPGDSSDAAIIAGILAGPEEPGR